MSEAAILELILRSVALALAAWGARLALDLGDRIALEQATYMGLAAFTFANLRDASGEGAAAIAALGVAMAAGAAVGALVAPLSPSEGAAVSIALQLAATTGGARLAVTGGHMGLAQPPTATATGASAIVGTLVLAAILFFVVGRRGKDLRRELRLWVEARPLAESLGRQLTPARTLLGLGSAGLAGAGGILIALSLEHLHITSFGLGRSLDAVAVALLATGPLGLAVAGGAWTFMEDQLAHIDGAHGLALAMVLMAGALRRRRTTTHGQR